MLNRKYYLSFQSNLLFPQIEIAAFNSLAFEKPIPFKDEIELVTIVELDFEKSWESLLYIL